MNVSTAWVFEMQYKTVAISKHRCGMTSDVEVKTKNKHQTYINPYGSEIYIQYPL